MEHQFLHLIIAPLVWQPKCELTPKEHSMYIICLWLQVITIKVNYINLTYIECSWEFKGINCANPSLPVRILCTNRLLQRRISGGCILGIVSSLVSGNSTNGATTLNSMILCITTFSIMKFSITIKNALRIIAFNTIMLSVIYAGCRGTLHMIYKTKSLMSLKKT
jgi:hypothetical protein